MFTNIFGFQRIINAGGGTFYKNGHIHINLSPNICKYTPTAVFKLIFRTLFTLAGLPRAPLYIKAEISVEHRECARTNLQRHYLRILPRQVFQSI